MVDVLNTREVTDLGRADAAFAGEIGRMVRLGRAKRGMSRRQLAQESGTSERYLAQIESGAGNPSILVMRAIGRKSPCFITRLMCSSGSALTQTVWVRRSSNP